MSGFSDGRYNQDSCIFLCASTEKQYSFVRFAPHLVFVCVNAAVRRMLALSYTKLIVLSKLRLVCSEVQVTNVIVSQDANKALALYTVHEYKIFQHHRCCWLAVGAVWVAS